MPRANPPLELSPLALNLSAIPTKLSSADSTLNRADTTFTFRVPNTSIELKVKTAKPISGDVLGNTLLRIHEYLNDAIEEQGDGPLAPTDDPFVWRPSGPPTTNSKVINGLSVASPMSLTVASVKGVHMTWSVLLEAVEGLYLCLPAAGRQVGATFEIWDVGNKAQWGFGEVKEVQLTHP